MRYAELGSATPEAGGGFFLGQRRIAKAKCFHK